MLFNVSLRWRAFVVVSIRCSYSLKRYEAACVGGMACVLERSDSPRRRRLMGLNIGGYFCVEVIADVLLSNI